MYYPRFIVLSVSMIKRDNLFKIFDTVENKQIWILSSEIPSLKDESLKKLFQYISVYIS